MIKITYTYFIMIYFSINLDLENNFNRIILKIDLSIIT